LVQEDRSGWGIGGCFLGGIGAIVAGFYIIHGGLNHHKV
jgi:hypothetical protein